MIEFTVNRLKALIFHLVLSGLYVLYLKLFSNALRNLILFSLFGGGGLRGMGKRIQVKQNRTIEKSP